MREPSLGDGIDNTGVKSTCEQSVDAGTGAGAGTGVLDSDKLNQDDPFEAMLNKSQSVTESYTKIPNDVTGTNEVETEQLVDLSEGSVLVDDASHMSDGSKTCEVITR